MTCWLLAAGLLAFGAIHNAGGYSGMVHIDFGRVVPGHYYYYRGYFRNDTGVPLKLTGSSLGCGGCPKLLSARARLAPGDSTELYFSAFAGKNVRDSMWSDVKLYTDDGSRRGLWIYRLHFSTRRPTLVRPVSAPVKTDINREGYLEGTLTITSLGREDVRIVAAGLPAGVRFDPPMPMHLERGRQAIIKFTSPPELFTRHRSLTLQLTPDGGGKAQRISLPLSP